MCNPQASARKKPAIGDLLELFCNAVGSFMRTATAALATMSTAARVETPHAYTGRMCAASRFLESQRADALFNDHLAHRLAGDEGLAQPMGDWIMTPRTVFGDDLLRSRYAAGVRQLVLLGAGMDARAYRMTDLPELRVFEVDQKTTFDVKEPLLHGEPLAVASRHTVATEFTQRGKWLSDLMASGFDAQQPSVWLLEGLTMYLTLPDTHELMREIGKASASGSVLFHDACSAHYMRSKIVVGGAPFVGGSDEYAQLWADHAGYSQGYVYDFSRAISVDRKRRRIVIDERAPEASPQAVAGKAVVLFVVVQKP